MQKVKKRKQRKRMILPEKKITPKKILLCILTVAALVAFLLVANLAWKKFWNDSRNVSGELNGQKVPKKSAREMSIEKYIFEATDKLKKENVDEQKISNFVVEATSKLNSEEVDEQQISDYITEETKKLQK
jgi:hypothetical protein